MTTGTGKRGIHSLSQLHQRLREEAEVPAVFTCINTRLIIQTGVNLKKISPEQDRDPVAVSKVLGALARMGVDLEAP